MSYVTRIIVGKDTYNIKDPEAITADNLATVATTGNYVDLLNKPIIPEGTVDSVAVENDTDGGLTVTGSPISVRGTIKIGHSNQTITPVSQQSLRPIAFDKKGHITGYGNVADANSVGAIADPESKSDGQFLKYNAETEQWEAVSGGVGDGTVTSVTLSNSSSGDLEISNPTITSQGTIEIKHANTVELKNQSTAKTVSAVYPITLDDFGHIKTVDAIYNPCKTWTATLTTNWTNNQQQLSSQDFIANGYVYFVSPSGNPSAYGASQIYADNVTTNGVMLFHCSDSIPTESLQVTISRMISV